MTAESNFSELQRAGGAGHLPICQMGKTPMQPTRYVRNKATMSWNHYLNNFSLRNNRMQAMQTEAMARYVPTGTISQTLPRGKMILTKLCDGGATEAGVLRPAQVMMRLPKL